MISGLTHAPGLELPSPLHVVAVVVITLGLATGAIVLLKRILANGRAPWNGEGIRILARASLGPSLRAHVLEVAAARVLVIEGRSGIGLTVLPHQDRNPEELPSK